MQYIEDNTKHSHIGASSMYRWSNCPGSVKLSLIAERPPSSVHAVLGTKAHEVAEYYLNKGVWPHAGFQGLSKKEIKSIIPAVKVYTDYIAYLKISEPNSNFHVEHSFDMGQVYPGAYGTTDFVLYNPDTKNIKVVDYKNGKGRVVEVEDNSQLLYYALGAVSTLNYPFRTVELVVVQPRAVHKQGPIRSWTVHAEKMLEFRVELIKAAKRTEDKVPKFAHGGHCFFCPAIEICPLSTQAKAAKKNAFKGSAFKTDPKDVFKPIAPAPHEVKPEFSVNQNLIDIFKPIGGGI